MDRPALNEDFDDLLAAFRAEGVEYLVVGAHALAVHGVPRATGDLDLWIRPSPENAARVLSALRRFGAPVEAHGVKAEDFTRPGTVYQLGLPPRRIDLLTGISGVGFDEAWGERAVSVFAKGDVPVLGRQSLIKNKKAAGRDKDLLDVQLLEAQARR